MAVRSRMPIAFLFAAALIAAIPAAARSSFRPQEKKDYLTDSEADKIRDADTPSLRIKLFMSYAEDRMKKLQYELGRKTPDARRDEMLNSLINAYVGCVDDASDQIDEAKQKQMDVHDALKMMAPKLKEYLEYLQKLDKEGSGPEFESYKDTLEDAIEGTQDAMDNVAKAQKEMLPPPVRRKQ